LSTVAAAKPANGTASPIAIVVALPRLMSNAIGVLFDGRSKLLRLVELGKCEGKMIESDPSPF
jgi:hypothetical protein